MKCQICNEKKHQHNAIFCHVCGTPLKKQHSTVRKMTWDILLLTILLLFSIVVSLSEICGIGSDDAYFAVFGNACLMIMSILYCCTISEEEVGLLQRLSRYCLTAALMAAFYALTFFLPDVWSITAVMVLLAIISPFMDL